MRKFLSVLLIFYLPFPVFAQTPPLVALTFDDGPKPELSSQILDILDHFGIKATFFVVGKEVEDNPDMVLRMHESGHEVGNHSFTHARFENLSPREIEREIKMTNDVIFRVTGRRPRYFRSPGDYCDEVILSKVKKYGLTYVSFSINGKDYAGSFGVYEDGKDLDSLAADLEKRIFENLHPGAVILFHNGSPQTVAALPKIIEKLHKIGYGFVKVRNVTD